ncbi:MAG TPA: crossover junction endodeoxyribonuclease RuvC [Sphingopyxis sp.]|nr:crossover junction endodeoxyribonuclease RuvC [Sphingopyxis sp.]
MIILGLDPSLTSTGWGIIRAEGSRISHIANGQIKTNAKMALPDRLAYIDTVLAAVIADHSPTIAAVEEVFVNDNPQSTLKLAHARGVILLGCARGGIAVTEYAARLVKKAIVGTGAASKDQVQAMLRVLLPGAKVAGSDAADALAVAICHANHRTSPR